MAEDLKELTRTYVHQVWNRGKAHSLLHRSTAGSGGFGTNEKTAFAPPHSGEHHNQPLASATRAASERLRAPSF